MPAPLLVSSLGPLPLEAAHLPCARGKQSLRLRHRIWACCCTEARRLHSTFQGCAHYCEESQSFAQLKRSYHSILPSKRSTAHSWLSQSLVVRSRMDAKVAHSSSLRHYMAAGRLPCCLSWPLVHLPQLSSSSKCPAR